MTAAEGRRSHRLGKFNHFFISLGFIIAAVSGLTAEVSAASVVRANQYGFSFSLPPRWSQINLDSKDVGAILRAATKGDPDLTSVLNSDVAQAAKSGVKIFAVGPIAGLFFSNLNIIVESAAGEPTGEAFLAAGTVQEKISFVEAGAHQIRVSTVRLPMARAVETTYVLHLGHLLVRGLQLVFEHGSHVYVVTFSSTNPKQNTSVAHFVEESWSWT